MSIRQKNQATAWEKFQSGLFGSKVAKLFVYITLTLWSMTTIFPLAWVINNSFKDSNEVVNESFKIAASPSMQNYINAFDKMDIGKSYINSLIMSGGTVILVLLFGGLAAYILSRFRFRLRGFIQIILVMSLLIPSFATVVPVFEILLKMDLLNTHLALILPHTAGFLPFAVLVLSGYMATIPKELEEAALMDGASRWKIFFKVFVPISKTSFATCSIFVFLWSYNDLFSSLIFVENESVRPIVVLLSYVSSQYGTDYGLMAAAITITVIPVLIVYLLIQRYFEKGLTAGAVKG